MFSSFSSVGFCGSRSLPASAQPLVASVVSTVLSGSPASPAGGSARLAVGCSVGADALVLSSVPSASLFRVSVFSAFGFSGRGACSLSAVQLVQAAGRGGAFVNWWSGGRLHVPLRLRLAKRSLALVRFLAKRPSALVCFLSSPKSRGSLLTCRLAVRFGISVLVFCVGFSPSRLPRLGHGSWSLVQVAGSQACKWSPCPPFSPHNKSLKRHAKKLPHKSKNAFSIGLFLFAVIAAAVLSCIVPKHPIPTTVSNSNANAAKQYTSYQDLLLPFYNENESVKCLQWLNTMPAPQLQKILLGAKIQSNRIDTLISNRPYTSWTEVYYLQTVGIKTIENTITAWRKSK